MVHSPIARYRLSLTVALLLALGHGGSSHAASVLLDFTSPHCGPCQELKPTIERLVAEGYPVRVVDVSREQDLARQFGVTRVPCLVLVTDNREQARLHGAASYDQLCQMFATAGVHPVKRVQSTASVQSKGIGRGQSPDPRNPWAGDNRPPALEPGVRIPPSPAAERAPTTPSGIVAPAGDAPAAPYVAPGEFEQRLLRSSVRIKVEDANGHSFGTGTIIDTMQNDALVITCGHLFRGEAEKGTITIEIFEATPTGVRVIDTVPGRLESFDLDRDIGLVSFKPRTPVTVARVAAQPADRVNEPVWSVGCDRGADPTVRSSHVTALDRYHGAPNLEAAGAPVEGRSGGGLFNRQGELVGVCFAADPQEDEGLYGAIPSIHGELERLGLERIYSTSATAGVSAQPLAERRITPLPPGGSPLVMRGQDPDSTTSPAPLGQAAPAVAPPTQSLAESLGRLSTPERAALEELAQRASQAEVVCIVRSREPGSASEVLHLDSVSPEFLAALRAPQTGQTAAP